METAFRHRRLILGVVLIAAIAVPLVGAIRESILNVALLVLALVVLGGLPFLLGFVAQLLLTHVELRDRFIFIAAVALMLPWWFWGQGWWTTVPGPRIVSLFVSVVYLAWFAGLGAATVRMMRERRRAKTPALASEV